MRVSLERSEERIHDKPYFYPLGIGFLALAKIKYHIDGYTPKPPISDIDGNIDYDIAIAHKYLSVLKHHGESIEGKDVLELGPGEDLGLGAYLLSLGARSYTAFDLHPNASRASGAIYERLNQRGIRFDRSKLTIKVDREFSLIKSLPRRAIDIVVSNAAFEHFDEPERVLRELSWIVRPRGVLCATVDLQTHSRWIRDEDPNNIYRYPDWLYRAFRFPGQPNRVRTAQYQRYLEAAGWKNMDIQRENTHEPHTKVHRQFRECDDLDILSFTMFARS